LTGAKERFGSENPKPSLYDSYALPKKHPMYQKEDPSRRKDSSMGLISKGKLHPARELTSQKGDPSKQEGSNTDKISRIQNRGKNSP